MLTCHPTCCLWIKIIVGIEIIIILPQWDLRKISVQEWDFPLLRMYLTIPNYRGYEQGGSDCMHPNNGRKDLQIEEIVNNTIKL